MAHSGTAAQRHSTDWKPSCEFGVVPARQISWQPCSMSELWQVVADLRAPLRASDDDSHLQTAIRHAIGLKPKGHDFDYSRQTASGQVSRHMSHTGG